MARCPNIQVVVGRQRTNNPNLAGNTRKWSNNVTPNSPTGRVIGTFMRVIYGDEEETLKLLGKSTAYIERTHLSMRHFNSRLVRKTLAFSKLLKMYRAAAAWEDVVYNLARSLKTLRVEVFNDPQRRWRQRSPAMTAGLTDHIWTIKELLTTVAPP